MSNLWLNIRIFSYHIMVGEPHLWSVRIQYNPYHKQNGWHDGYFGWY